MPFDPHRIETLVPLILEEGGADPIALFSGGAVLSRAAHGAAARRVAHRLRREHGLKPGGRVLILAPTGPDLLAALSGCWLGGLLAGPIDATTRPERLHQHLPDFRPDIILIDAGLDPEGELREIVRSYGCVVENLSEQSGWAAATESYDIQPGDPALCIFTSGSTGMPKGVVLSHGNMLEGGRNVIAALKLTADDRAMCVLPLSHLNGLMTTYLTPLLSGGSIVFLQGAFRAEYVLKLIDENRCTWFSGVPTQYAQLMRPPIEKDHWSLATLRFCRSASASLHPRLRADFEAHYGVPIIETMGMTETSAQIFSNPLPPGERKTGSVGQAIGFEVRIVDDAGRACDDDEVGEFEIRGSGLMLGYLDNPQETLKAYDGSWLRSGDLGYRDPEGYHFITGRKKEIAIFAGLNISLRALENRVLDQKFVDDIACVSEPDSFFGEVVVAYVQTAEPADAYEKLVARVQEVLNTDLPNRQALKEIRIVDAFARTAVGKVIKEKLSEATVLFRSSDALPKDPRALLAEILSLPDEAITEDLALGRVKAWDSLAHTVLVTAVEMVLARVLSPREIMALTSYRGLVRVMDGSLPAGDDESEFDEGAGDGAEDANPELVALMKWNGLLPESADADGRQAADRKPRTIVTRTAVIGALREAGLSPGDVVLLHSDITGPGTTEAWLNRDAVLKFYLSAIQEVLTGDGTLVVCTSFEDYGRYGTPFVREDSPSRLGAFSEYVRTRPDAIRSIHPIVSLTALGPRAEDICGGAHLDGFGSDSPWGRLHRMNAKLMTMGMIRYPEMGLTFIHYIEHLYGVPYQYTKVYRAPVYAAGQEIPGPFTMSVRYLDYGITYDTNKFRERLVSEARARVVPLGIDAVFCTTCNEAISVAFENLRCDRYFFLKEPPKFRAGEIPMDGPTGEIQQVYDKATGP